MYFHGVATLDSMGMVGMVYVTEHKALQHTKYIS